MNPAADDPLIRANLYHKMARLDMEREEIALRLSHTAPRVPPCVCVRNHTPMLRISEAHHVWPVGMGGPEHPATLLGLCPTTHDWVHGILRDFVKNGWHRHRHTEPFYAFQVATLGWQAWDAAGQPETVMVWRMRVA